MVALTQERFKTPQQRRGVKRYMSPSAGFPAESDSRRHGDKAQAMCNAGGRIFRVMRNKQQLSPSLANQHIDKAPHELAVNRVEPL